MYTCDVKNTAAFFGLPEKTLERWLEGVANDFVNRSSNGRTDGFNHGLRAVLWRAFDLRNFRHFRLRVLDACGQPRTQDSTEIA